MASITGKRLSLHKYVEEQKQENDALKSKLAQIQHLANTGTISHMIAHEINNLLTPLKNYAALALDNPDDKSLNSTLKGIASVIEDIKRFLD